MGQKAKNLQIVMNSNPNIYIPKFLILDANHVWEQKTIEKLIKEHNLKGQMFAVRSSSESEDTSNFSFAGLYKSFLNVLTNDLESKVREVSESYKVNNNNYETLKKPSIIIQEMVNPQKSGVLFTSNPLTSKKEYVINANFGLCNSVVDGENCDEYIVDYNGNIIGKNIADLKVGRFSEGEKSFEEEECLKQEEINKLLNLSEQLKQIFTAELDIEFSFENNQLVLLQVRPITNLKEYNPILWDNSNIVESYDGFTLPLTFSFICECYSNVYKEFAHIAGFNTNKIQEYEHIFDSMIGINQGQVYYNLLSWYKLLMAFPGGKKNKKYMEQMMGVKSSLPTYFDDEIKFNDKSFFQTVSVIYKMFFFYVRFNSHAKKFDKMINQEIAHSTFDEMSLQNIRKFYITKSKKIFAKWKAPLANDMFVMIFWGKTLSLYNKYNIESKIPLDQVMYQKDLFSMEPFKLLNELTKDIKGNQELLEQFTKGNYKAIIHQDKFKDFNTKLSNYRTKFGFRVSRELKLESQTLIEDENILFERLKEQLNSNISFENTNEIHFKQLKDVLGFKKAIWFNFWLKRTKKHINLREKMRYDRTIVFGKVRILFLEVATRLIKDNIIDEQSDIFYLKVDEVLGLINGCAIDKNVKDIITLRKKEYEKYSTLNNRIQSNGFITDETFYNILNANQSEALGVSVGTYTGKIQIINDIANEQILPDSIIVTKIIDPGWIIYFAQIKGLIIEHGGMLSHSAIVARELKIPAIVNYKDATKVLKNGQLVEINGQTGEVKIL